MSFLHPEFLYFMLPLLVLLFSMLLTQQELKETVFSVEALKKLSVDADQFSNKTRNVFYFMMFFFLILALASPVLERGHAVTMVEDDTFYIAIESSQKDFQRARKTAKEVVTQLNGAKVGLLIFGAESYLVSPPTEDYELLKQYIATLEPIPRGETSYEVLLQSVDLLMDNTKSKQLVVISDTNLTKLHALASQKKIKLFSVNDAYFMSIESQKKPIYFYLFIVPIALAMIMLLIATSSFYRGESHYVPTLLVLFLMSSFEPLQAELLSYKTLEHAQKSYDVGAYEKSAQTFKRYGMKMESEEAIYNAANSLYKARQYKKALSLYRSIHFVAADKNYALYHNLGNTLVALRTEENLHEAVLMYEKALTFRERSETRENLQRIQKYFLGVNSRANKYRVMQNRVSAQHSVKKESNSHNIVPLLDTTRARYYKIELQK